MSFRPAYPDSTYHNEYTFTANKKRLDLDYLYTLLCLPSRYSTGLPPERFCLIIENSFCFSVFHHDKQIGFARVVSDRSEFASLWDVFIDESHRGKGVCRALLKYIIHIL